MEELMKNKCNEYGVDINSLTENERFQLRKEIEAEQQGFIVMDSVLDSHWLD